MLSDFRKAALAATLAGSAIVGAMATAHAVPSLSVNPADFGDATNIIDFNGILPADPIVGTELTNQGAPVITFAGGFFVYLDVGTNTVFGTNFSTLASPNNPVGMQFGTDITQIAFDFEAIAGDLTFTVSKNGGPATVLAAGINSGPIGIVDPNGFDTVLIAVSGAENVFAMNIFAYGGTPSSVVPEPASMLFGMVGLLAAMRLRKRNCN